MNDNDNNRKNLDDQEHCNTRKQKSMKELINYSVSPTCFLKTTISNLISLNFIHYLWHRIHIKEHIVSQQHQSLKL
ncbi:hypothetical protein Glove_395g50 [Diversispora epigaea]|uniref:Uncharacterized protein n=1 Tax=Diversispora epigaea TaxID=1348612 RepID=A0A397H9D1_9GLOM|nr:hypothetical protein Glove_395g50 [Diversispora epigaea]